MRCRLWFLVFTLGISSASAQVNSWTNPTSGSWDDPSSWSLHALPGSSQSIVLTNSGWKAVAINPSTPLNFPDSMTVSNLTIQGSTNTQNVLLLNYFGTDVPLTVLNSPPMKPTMAKETNKPSASPSAAATTS